MSERIPNEREPGLEPEQNPQYPQVYRRNPDISFEEDIDSFTIGDWILDMHHIAAAAEKATRGQPGNYRAYDVVQNLDQFVEQLIRRYPEIGREVLDALNDQDSATDFGEIGSIVEYELQNQHTAADASAHWSPPDDPSSPESGVASAG